MTENEKLTINGKEVTLYREVETDLYRFSKDAVDILLEALEEVEKYRAIGTVEEIEATIKNLNKVLLEHKDKLAPYVNIGTVEEFKALKEKNEPMQLAEHNFQDEPHHYLCPVCRNIVSHNQSYCEECGQALET